MKKTTFFLFLTTMMLAFMGNMDMSAQKTGSTPKVKTVEYKYSSERKNGSTDISIEVPVGDTPATKLIREDLWTKMKDIVKNDVVMGWEEDTKVTYAGQDGDFQALCDFYGKATDITHKINKEDLDDNGEAPQEMIYSITTSLAKSRETSRYIVFWQTADGYAGGAHGSIWGKGGMTYDLRTGKEVKDFIKPSAVKAMQPLLKRYLKTYFQEGKKPMTDRELMEELMLDGNIIPLPAQYNIYPSNKGLEFIYGQYEIACYAAGMPSFTLPYSVAKPYMTQEAKTLLGIK